jgi:hypothetical protein
VLAQDDTKTKWWHLAFNACSAICFGSRCLEFYHPATDTPTKAPFGPHILYFGCRPEKFIQAFAGIGTAIRNTWTQGASHHDDAIIIKRAKHFVDVGQSSAHNQIQKWKHF